MDEQTDSLSGRVKPIQSLMFLYLSHVTYISIAHLKATELHISALQKQHNYKINKSMHHIYVTGKLI